MLKQRRGGLKYNVNEAELAEAVKDSKNKAKAVIAWLLKKGFLPTQIADSFAISMGGASYYRNRINITGTLSEQGYFEGDSTAIANVGSSSYVSGTKSFEKTTYINHIGIYDENRNLIAVTKLANPVRKRENDDYTFKLKLDI